MSKLLIIQLQPLADSHVECIRFFPLGLENEIIFRPIPAKEHVPLKTCCTARVCDFKWCFSLPNGSTQTGSRGRKFTSRKWFSRGHFKTKWVSWGCILNRPIKTDILGLNKGVKFRTNQELKITGLYRLNACLLLIFLLKWNSLKLQINTIN